MADPELVQILREEGSEAWNAFVEERRAEDSSWRADLDGAKIIAVTLRGASLSGSILTDANFNVGDLSKADLSGADLRRANLVDTNLRGANLRGANLSGADLFSAKLSDADLAGASLRASKLSFADLRDADLRDADLCDADLRCADLRRASLVGTDLANAEPIDADLVDADLVDAHLSYADLTGADLTGADLTRADLTGADLTRADLTGADLTGADLTNADLFSADVTRARLVGTRFSPVEESGLGTASFLDLATCKGLASVRGLDLSVYLVRAFEYAHRKDTEEALDMPRFVSAALEGINSLRALQAETKPNPVLTQAIDTLTAELIDYLKKHPDQLYGIPPHVFEEIVAEVLASFGWQVDLTPKSNDGGYDIFAISPLGSANVTTSWLVECKRYAKDRPVGVDVVRALYGSDVFLSKSRPGARAANKLLATTSYFTKGVYELKASTYDLALKDYEGILDWLNTYRPNPNGKLYLDSGGRLVVPG